MPRNAIDDIISQLGGHENVGEISSRKKRWILDENNNRVLKLILLFFVIHLFNLLFLVYFSIAL